MNNKTPKEIVKILNSLVVGHLDAKKCLANALRNRWRRSQVAEPLRSEITPKNILLVGSTGVGKTELARRLAIISDAPFIKVEATKFTEVGYRGRDVEQIIRDLIEIEIQNIKKRKSSTEIALSVENKLLDALYGKNASYESREDARKKLRNGELDNQLVELESKIPKFDFPDLGIDPLVFENAMNKVTQAFGELTHKKRKRITVSEAKETLMNEIKENLLPDQSDIAKAIDAVEQNGIVFIDEIDKIAEAAERQDKGRVSREGVQRDLLPLVEGTIITTKYGPISTNHILFIASGAFHMSEPKDLIPEFRGRFPIEITLQSLGIPEFIQILKNLDNNLLYQAQALLAIDGISLSFTDDAIEAIAEIAFEKNAAEENLGARRLHQLLEIIISEVSFNMEEKNVNFTAEDVKNLCSIGRDNLPEGCL